MWLILLIAALSALYLFVRHLFGYWERRGVPHLPYRIPFGHITDLSDFKNVLMPSYEHFKNSGTPFVGLYVFHLPKVLVLDPELLKHIMIKDFDHFPDRGAYVNANGDPLSGHLVRLGGDEWRWMRAKLTPTFTSGKMKFMFPTMLGVTRQFVSSLNGLVDTELDLDVKDLLGRLTTDIIGMCAFGIDCNSLTDPDAEFRRMGKVDFQEPRHGAFGTEFMQAFQRLALLLNMKIMRNDVIEFFMNVVDETVKTRERDGIRRNDFMDLLIELKNQTDESGAAGLTIKQMAAQVFVFFQAGFLTSSTAMMFALYELALNEDVQKRARTEIQEVLDRHNGNYTYEAMMEMRYLDQVINESIRKYPTAQTLQREVAKDYLVPGTNHILPKGLHVNIPVYAIHHDSNYYSDPERFDPERFAPEAKANRNSVSYLGFGQGPRNCIGQRFAMMQMRLGLVSLLCNYEIGRSAKTHVPLILSKKGSLLNVDGGMWLKLKKIAKEH